MLTITNNEFQQTSNRYMGKPHEPVFITNKGQVTDVILSYQDYQNMARLTQLQNKQSTPLQSVHLTDLLLTMPNVGEDDDFARVQDSFAPQIFD